MFDVGASSPEHEVSKSQMDSLQPLEWVEAELVSEPVIEGAKVYVTEF